MSKIIWVPEALEDFLRLQIFLKEKSPEAAARAARTIKAGADLLKSSTQLGRPLGDDTGRRELVLPFGSGAYILHYKLQGNTVVIIRVWHSRESRMQ